MFAKPVDRVAGRDKYILQQIQRAVPIATQKALRSEAAAHRVFQPRFP